MKKARFNSDLSWFKFSWLTKDGKKIIMKKNMWDQKEIFFLYSIF